VQQSLLTLDGTVAVQVINFAAFLGLLNIVYLRPAGKALAARRAHIDAIAADYEKAHNEAAAIRAAGETRRLSVRRECEDLLSKARTEAIEEADTIAARAAALAHERISTAHATAAGEMSTAREREHQLTEEIADLLLKQAIGAAV
jgi:F0F1-type ATP synthase membrane subunit b/b'